MNAQELISPQSLALLQAVNQSGSMAGAARALGLVPSSVTYHIRKIEEALDVLLFDRSGRRATITAAGQELLREGERVLAELDAVARRVRRVATGWEPELTLAIDGLIDRSAILDLVASFYGQFPTDETPPTKLRVQVETLSGPWHALQDGLADLCLGGLVDNFSHPGIETQPIGDLAFVFAVAPHHPLAQAAEPIPDRAIQKHRIVAMADSSRRAQRLTFGILPGQDVLTVSSLTDKIEAQIRGLGCGFVPLGAARSHIASGKLIVKTTLRSDRTAKMGYAWAQKSKAPPGPALSWWIRQLGHQRTRDALLGLTQT